MGKYYYKQNITLCITKCKYNKEKPTPRVGSAACRFCKHRLTVANLKDSQGLYINCAKIL